MVLPWRRPRACRRVSKATLLENGNSEMELMTVPAHFRCPISLDLMKDPVTLPSGITYDRENIERWIESGNRTCPVTNQALGSFEQIPNHAIRRMIQDWCVQHRSLGVERIPTPRIPVAPRDVSGICSKILEATQRGDQRKCQELVEKLKAWGRESERNKRCIAENGAGYVLSVSFDFFASLSIEMYVSLLEKTLSALTWMFPLGAEGRSVLGSPSSLRCMAWFLEGEDLTSRQNAVVALKELLSSDQKHVISFVEIDGVEESLVRMIKEQISPAATKAALMAIYHMISPSNTSEKTASRFVELGLVSLVLEILVGSERSVAEKALGVLDSICNYGQGIEKARHHPLTMPVLVKKILRVSNLATDFSVSIIWKLCRGEDGGDQQIEAVQLRAFPKMLVVLQIGCGEGTKEKATELLKLLNQYRDRLDCFNLYVGDRKM
ncbi:hypothetical protein RHGRI_030216 [Rhododendron griersonianum]|uniref:U-box domain-containing protein n=1 Tax=Rhododendron griersonianum TaxID=479676 RepID=A0AAV6ISI3_9ERIC|nr:hypothetical protein RHGRI_030216 [Rhododendron griersonianum]